jgi:hypothetical protein
MPVYGAVMFPTLKRTEPNSPVWKLRRKIMEAFPPGSIATTSKITKACGVPNIRYTLMALHRMERDNLVITWKMRGVKYWEFLPHENWINMPPKW